jgi:hypothetical protein
MASSEMLRRVALVRTDLSEELSALIVRVTRIGELEISSQRASVASYRYVPSSLILVTLVMEALSSSETSVLTSSTRRNITEDTISHSHRRENLKSFTLKSFNSQYREKYISLLLPLLLRVVADTNHNWQHCKNSI